MEIASSTPENTEPSTSKTVCASLLEFSRKTKELGQRDSRRICHAIKVSLSVTVVTLLFYFDPLNLGGFSFTAIFAVLSVVQVLEFSVGASLGRGINRMVGTLIGVILGPPAHHLATISGKTGMPIFITLFLIIMSAILSFMRCIPRITARYDNGLLMLLLTFCLVCVSSYEDNDALAIAKHRIIAIVIGSCTSMVISIFIFPVWIGEDLHNLVARNVEKIGDFLEGFGGEYFQVRGDGESNIDDKSFLQGYISVLSSKETEENMANMAFWEPCHGRFRFRHPWKQYLKVGATTRRCAYKIEALHGYLTSDTQTPLQIRRRIQEPCTKIALECGKALKELATTSKRMRRSTLADTHLANAKAEAENLKSMLKTQWWEYPNMLEITPALAVLSLLLEVVECTEKIGVAFRELSSVARFKNDQENSLHRRSVQPVASRAQSIEEPELAVTIEQ
ncbi:hypothetical protein K2173_021227 [Erythroxylum novogranatense]|uniref:Aluminum-activated malate transporter 2-like n=1 Tax=Erythroxylum novogranatense TaxID=1862640 RepID=A0AAV8TN47_9ROSI|nr:hypothetical protein K2173_021227 [Erythroxylum novogranatense]